VPSNTMVVESAIRTSLEIGRTSAGFVPEATSENGRANAIARVLESINLISGGEWLIRAPPSGERKHDPRAGASLSGVTAI
jgi:hypothetical protein